MPSHTATPAAPWWLALILSAASLGWAGYTNYTHNDKELAQRITAVEAHRADDTQRLDRVETKLDKLLDWALGSHK